MMTERSKIINPPTPPFLKGGPGGILRISGRFASILLFSLLPTGILNASDCPAADIADISLSESCVAAAFVDNRICVASPESGETFNQDRLCVFGKFMEFEDVRDLIDFVALVSVPENNGTVQEEVSGPEIPELDETGVFQIPLPLGDPGPYEILVRADFYTGNPSHIF